METSFSSLSLPENLRQNLETLGFHAMTEVQASSLPPIMAGKDVFAQAKTGSGKTVAFSLGLLSRLDMTRYRVQALVICPTRELADQVAEEIRKLGRQVENMKVLTLCGGLPMGPQIHSLSHGAHVVVGTPGRLMDHLLKGRLKVDDVKTLVLDEADRMLDMGFEQELTTVIKALSTERQTLLFSATYPDGIKQISNKIQRTPVSIELKSTHDTQKIQQIFFEIEPHQRNQATAALLTHYQPASCIVFCNTKAACQTLEDFLKEQGFSVAALHGDLEQKERSQVLERFANKSILTLVATDVAARGLDVKDIGAVINYDPAFDPEVHTHRVGRTGRADATGLALTLCAAKEVTRVNAIEEYQQSKLKWVGIASVRFHANRILQPEVITLCIDGGKKAKLRPGDILGALTKDADISGDDIGKIKVTATHSYVAVKLRSVKRALAHFRDGKMKGRKFKVRKLT